MTRAKNSVATRRRRKATLARASGYYGNKSRSFRAANEQLMHSGQYAYRDRRARKGEFRRLWVQRINAAARQNGTTYSRLIHALGESGIAVDRKVLADLAITDPAAFSAIVAKAGLGTGPVGEKASETTDAAAAAAAEAAAETADDAADDAADAAAVGVDATADAADDASAVGVDAAADAAAADAADDAAAVGVENQAGGPVGEAADAKS